MVSCVKLSTHLDRELLILIWQDSVCVHTVLVSVIKIIKYKGLSLEYIKKHAGWCIQCGPSCNQNSLGSILNKGQNDKSCRGQRVLLCGSTVCK